MSLPTCLLFYDSDGNIVGSLDFMVRYDDDGKPLGLVDFEAHELSGGRLRDIVEYSNAVGAGTWPEWLGPKAMDFKVKVRSGAKGGTHMVTDLVHKKSGHERKRVLVDSAMEDLARGKGPDDVIDARPVLGGPEFCLRIDDDGRNIVVPASPVRVSPSLPLRNIKLDEQSLESVSFLAELDVKRQEAAASGRVSSGASDKVPRIIPPEFEEALAKPVKKR